MRLCIDFFRTIITATLKRRENVMEISDLIKALSNPDAYSHPCEIVRVLQTHISVVFLAGDYAYKIKKPLNLGFLDFTSLEKREHFCREEVRLNKRLAKDVYLSAVPIAAHGNGLRVNAGGSPIEWAVWMKRLPESATFKNLLARGKIGAAELSSLAKRIASFHQSAPVVEHGGDWSLIADNALENFDQAEIRVGATVSSAVFQRTKKLTKNALKELKSVFKKRINNNFIRDNHGDLHLDHVYYFPEKSPPDDLTIIDCIEFNERFRYSDVVADIAFLYMDLKSSVGSGAAKAFADDYFSASCDCEGRRLLPFYSSYRAAVRGKVEGFEAFEPEVPEETRKSSLESARLHWLLALRELESAGRQPFLICIGGLPGSGKSTLARCLAERAGAFVLSSDVVRKELAGLSSAQPAAAPINQGIYTSKWTEKTYSECLSRAEAGLFDGQRIIVDATFRNEKHRLAFLKAAKKMGLPCRFIFCTAAPEQIYNRMETRQGGPSDADWRIYQHIAATWEPLGPDVAASAVEAAAGGDPDSTFEKIIKQLKNMELID